MSSGNDFNREIVEELLRLDNEGKLSKICKEYINGYIAIEYRAEPKVLVGGPCVKVTFGYSTDNQVISEERQVVAWTIACQNNIDVPNPANTSGPPSPNQGGNSIVNIEGLVTIVTLNSVTWTPLPAVNMPGRRAIAIQNFSGGIEIKINYEASGGDIDVDIPGYTGMIIPDSSERNYDAGPGITFYGKAALGNPVIAVEELK